MSQMSDQMELREEEVRAHYAAALAMLEGFDHAPRVATAREAAVERSPGVGRASRRFRSTTPGLSASRVARSSGVALRARIEGADEGDALVSPLQASVLSGLRRALAIALAVGEAYGERTELAALKRENLSGGVAAGRKDEFRELMSAEALAVLFVLGSATAFLLAPHASEDAVDVGDVEEVLTENAPLALHGALWELDQALALHGSDEGRVVATVLAYAEALMAKVSARAENAGRLEPFNAAAWHVEADDFAIRGFQAATKGKGAKLTMTFKEPHEVVGNHIAKYQAMKLAKMLMAYDFERRLNPFAELGGFIFTFMGAGAPGTGKTTLIQMMAGLINGYCEVAGYPFRYQNLSTDNIDSYQGKSGQNAKAFINNVLDPGVIG
ncbi:MAG: AAA family ATPase, partial [Pseudomonadota bacterium]